MADYWGVESTGADNVVLPSQCDGRLSLNASDPAPADVTGASTIYWLPYLGNQVALWTGSSWAYSTLGDSGISIAVASNSKPNDLFVWDNGGTLTLESVAWTDDTNRATALTRQNGVLVKAGAPARRYLGTYYGGGTISCTNHQWYLWNFYHRLPSPLYVQKTSSHTYSSGTVRPWGNLTDTTTRINFIAGLNDQALIAAMQGDVKASVAGSGGSISIGFDSTTVGGFSIGQNFTDQKVGQKVGRRLGRGASDSVLGKHYVQALESGHASGVDFTLQELHLLLLA